MNHWNRLFSMHWFSKVIANWEPESAEFCPLNKSKLLGNWKVHEKIILLFFTEMPSFFAPCAAVTLKYIFEKRVVVFIIKVSCDLPKSAPMLGMIKLASMLMLKETGITQEAQFNTSVQSPCLFMCIGPKPHPLVQLRFYLHEIKIKRDLNIGHRSTTAHWSRTWFTHTDLIWYDLTTLALEHLNTCPALWIYRICSIYRKPPGPYIAACLLSALLSLWLSAGNLTNRKHFLCCCNNLYL